MSLHIYFEGIDELPNLPIVRDVESLFRRVQLDGCDYDIKILDEIECGKYFDNGRFTDRFGCTLYRDYLSTGSKAALAIYHHPDNVIVSGVEIGRNALASIVRWCRHGHLLLEDSTYYLECLSEDYQIDVICKGKHYSSFDDFSAYMIEDAPYDD